MTYTEFWERLTHALGEGYSRVWADQHVMAELGGRTASQALDAGTSPRQVWRACWRALELPDRDW